VTVSENPEVGGYQGGKTPASLVEIEMESGFQESVPSCGSRTTASFETRVDDQRLREGR
jgi:hypothetical protein